MIIKKYLAGKILHPFFSFSRNLHYSPQEWRKLVDIVIQNIRHCSLGTDWYRCLGTDRHSCLWIVLQFHLATFVHCWRWMLCHCCLRKTVHDLLGTLWQSCLWTYVGTFSYWCLGILLHTWFGTDKPKSWRHQDNKQWACYGTTGQG